MKLISLLLLASLIIANAYESGKFYSILKDNNGQFLIVEGKQLPTSLAWGIFKDELHQDGWGKLSLYTNSFQTQEEAYAAGYLEAALTSWYIFYHKINFFNQIFENDSPTNELVQFLLEQYEFTIDQVKKHGSSNDYWKTIGLFQSFMLGLIDGYNSIGEEKIELIDMLILQANGDIGNIMKGVNPQAQTNWFSLNNQEFDRLFFTNNHCSLLVKVNDELSDVFMGHNTWASAQGMIRIYKFYEFGQDFQLEESGYPATIYSSDDYYVLTREDQKMFVSETTNHLFREEYLKKISPASLLCWQRVMVASTLATNGYEWTEIFKQFNSGTYNNQYIVVDTKLFKPGNLPSPGFIWIVEQMPQLIINKDVTQRLIDNGNYWPSYNVPFFKEIYDYAGFDQAYQEHGDKYSYENCPRAKIFRRDQSKVQTLEEQKKILRYNDYKNDPFSMNDPTLTLASRGDLSEGDQKVSFFAIDAKVTSWSRIYSGMNGVSDVINGPTYDQQPIFKWSDYNFTAYHYGHPDKFDFPWITVRQDQ